MKKTIPLFLLLNIFLQNHAEAGIVKIHRSNIEDLAQEYSKNAQCEKQYGDETKVAITVTVDGKSYVYSYCASEPGSAYLDEFYPQVLSVVAGLSAGEQCVKREYGNGGYINREYGNIVIKEYYMTLITNGSDIKDFRTTVVKACE